MSSTHGSNEQRMAGVIGFFDEPGALIEATKKTRDAKWDSFDAYTPYPVHGLEHAAGLKRSWLPYVTFCAGGTGLMCAFALQYWTSAVSWPINVGGKPLNSWPAFVPVMFELTVLFAGLCTVAAMLIANGMPNIKRRSFDPRLTRDRFALIIEPSSKKAFDEAAATNFLKGLGAKEVRTVFNEGWF
jgi:hypothetical protein